MKQANVEPARVDPRPNAAPVVPLRADAFALPPQRLRDLTRAELKAAAPALAPSDAALPQPEPIGDQQ